MNVIVIGAGIGGSSVAHVAREAGHEVTVVADPSVEPASHAAVCVIRPTWLDRQDAVDCQWSLGWYEQHGWLAAAEGETHNHQRGTEPRVQRGWYAVHPLAPLVDIDIPATVVGVGDGWVELADGYGLEADAVVDCRGINGATPGKALWGATFVAQVECERKVVNHVLRPRYALCTAGYGDELRAGSSKANDRATAVERLHREMSPLLPDADWSIVANMRLMPPNGRQAGIVDRTGERTWSIGSFGRVGYSVAPARARDLVRLWA